MMAKTLPEIDIDLCSLCGDCVRACPQDAVEIADSKLVLDGDRCAYCGDCEDLCPMGAIALPYEIIVVVPGQESEAATPEEDSRG